MDSLEKQALQVAKEIVVKFIEVGRISPANFSEHFSEIYGEILTTVSGGAERADQSAPKKADQGE
ncbi:MAG: hypothetical protein AUJ49_00710 [Desulfovibrionaceae bacterium CG1_02_65_16]|nr:MAG: hypothetical protein AUJ49_00710 [Desulfovibrionaceae bacterium CG1_02_65_16]